MRRAASLAAAALALLLAAGAAKPPVPQDQLLAADRAFAKFAADKGQAYALLAVLANDGRFYGAGEAPVIGRAQAFHRLGRREPGSFRRAPEAARVAADGRMGWTAGRWQTAAPGGKHDGGHYLAVWTRDGGGAWKLQAEMETSDPKAKK